LKNLVESNDLQQIKNDLKQMREALKKFPADESGIIEIISNDSVVEISKKFLDGEIQQILETKTLERTHYYLKRLVKSVSEKRTGKVNDLNLNRWKEYDGIITDSLWIFKKRDSSGAHNAGYWGNFIPQIPNQLIQRYTKKGEWVLDPFLGSGTTLIECRRLGRNGIGIDINPKVCRLAERYIAEEKNPFKIYSPVILADSGKINLHSEIKNFGIQKVQFVLMHPPYWDIIKFSDDESDLSNSGSVEEFLKSFSVVLENCLKILDKGRFIAVVIGDKYSGGEWIPLGFYTMREFLNRGLKLKSTVVKNFDETTAKRQQKELWRYRALAGGFYIFKHEYIFIFQKTK
jgi:hypothetical protein